MKKKRKNKFIKPAVSRRLSALLLCLCLLVGLLPTGVLAADGGFTYYTTDSSSTQTSSPAWTINSNGSYTVTSGSGTSIAFGPMTMGATLNLAGDITVTEDITGNLNKININSGFVNVGSTISSQTKINISGGHVEAENISVSTNTTSGTMEITIEGGIVKADSISVHNQQNGNNLSQSLTINGDAVVFVEEMMTNTTGTGTDKGVDYTKGVVFTGNTGTVYGNVTLPDDVTIPEGYTLTIPSGASLTVPGSTTLTNYGTINVQGTLTNNGTTENYGTINGTVNGNIPLTQATDFVVTATNSGETLKYGIDYTYPADDSRVLTILSEKEITISNADPDTATTHRIYVEDGVNANVTLAGVNIHTQGNGSPFSIAGNSTGNVTVTLADGTENVLISGSTDVPGLQKNGDASSGTLTINGNGKLTATGNWNGAGIGGSPVANIVIESGTIIANSNAGGGGIGSTYRSDAYNITIKGGTVTATGGVRENYGRYYYSAGIGSGSGGSAYNIVITGGSVRATAQGSAQPVGKGSGNGTAEAPTDGNGNPVYLYEIENPQKADIIINGNDYPDTHGEETKIYVYLPAKTAQDPNVIAVGDTIMKLYYSSGRCIEVIDIPAADNTVFTYTGKEKTYTIAESDYYTVSGNKQTNAGAHTVTVALKDKINTVWSDGSTGDKTYSFVIGKDTLSVPTNLQWTNGYIAAWDEVTNATGYTVQLYKNGEKTGDPITTTGTSYNFSSAVNGVGNYTFTVTAITTDSTNYNNSEESGQSTAKPVIALNTGGYTGGEWTNKDVTLSIDAPDGATVQYKTGSDDWQNYTGAITVSDDTNETKYFFRAVSTDSVTGEEVSVTVKLDKTAPGNITVSTQTNTFREFMNTITFGLFFKDTQEVTISAADVGSGVKEISYQLGDGELQTVTAEDGKITFRVEPQFVGNIHNVTVTDNANNTTESTDYEYFAVDSESPAAPSVNTNGYTSNQWTNGDVTITVSGVTADSGIAKYQFSTDNGASWQDMTISSATAATAETPYNADSATLTVTDNSAANNGTAYVFRAVSNSGMEGTPSDPITVKIDKTEPAIEVSGDTTSYLQSDTVTIVPTAGVSGIASVNVSKDDGTPETIQTVDGSYTYTIRENGIYTFTVTNGVGVTATTSITYTNIDRATPVVVIDSNGYTDGAWTNSDVTLEVFNSTANLGDTEIKYKVDDGEWQTYSTPITVSEDTNGTVYSFRATSESGVESNEVSITVKLDKTEPNGDIIIAENSVKKFINEVTFGLFYNENMDVEITAGDALSGIKSVEYFRSAEQMSEEQVKAITDWAEYSSVISETAADADKFIYYVKVTDNAGNAICFASNGVTFDLTKPVISGITDKETYYTTQKAEVTDANLESVTLNGEATTSPFTLAGNVEADTVYTIVAADKAGNTTTYEVTMRPTASLSETISGITPENVTSENQSEIEDYLNDLNTRLEDENLTEEEKEIIQNLADDAQDLLDRIDEAEQAGNPESAQEVQDITPDNVTPSDKNALETAKEDVQKALDEYGDNYTAEEKARLEETLAQIEKTLEVIERVADVEDAVSALPETVTPDDTEAEKQIDAAKELYDGLSEYEKSLVADEMADKLNSLLAQIGDYRIIEGSGSTWTKGSAEGLTIVANGAYSKFTGIEIDGNAVNAENYTATGDKTTITLKPAYLNTLAEGEHTITVLYTDGEATGTFTVAEKPATSADGNKDTTSPLTGAESEYALWVALGLALAAAFTGTAVYGRKRKHSR